MGVTDPLRKLGLMAIALGAAGSVGLVLIVARRNPSIVLLALFAIWVLVPFAVLAVADGMSKEWSAPTRTALHALMIVTTIDTLGIYGYIAFGPSRPQPAFWFLIVPPASVVLTAIVLRVAAGVSSSQSGGDK